ncbi:hypothetical protein CP985_02890 [Malaciobacter mytili LMG 24559]|uniref:Restriction endonuclease type II NgoFVII N-terminal domain-containing protein n=1 Tax=Malaciobacter mytili LMG 24559 TaxID=1032238 RepID=A0AAX2AJI8_9BACT|nr:phospholipase D family protein [Malaciobacter mytili]AXH14289.1 putative type II restriction endonuclease [Malaciobacter mytili LMG 24559]RXK16512.1 hypothetical protein CP985_02890 [Malaciobacter mytili LMG 24559]
MEIINNTSGLCKDIKIVNNVINSNTIKNHKELLKSLISISDKVIIASPFLMEDFEDFFKEINIKNVYFELITTCIPRGNEQIIKPFQLNNFAKTIKLFTNKWPKIHLMQSLHSKIYLFYKDDIRLCGIVTSANFTIRGLVSNHETGIITTSSQTIETLENELLSSIDYVSLSEYQIKQLCVIAEKMKNEKRFEFQKDIDIRLEKNIEKLCTPSKGNKNIKLKENAQYFIKVSGVKDRPILPADKRKINEPHTVLHFAREPKKIKNGDCLLEVAVGGKCFLSYYTKASNVFFRTEKEQEINKDYKRWPFYIYANNLSLNFGEKWFETPLYYEDVIKGFKNKFPNCYITYAGGNSLKGAIQLGNSYIQVTKEFGEYVKEIIDNQ